jgi:hypothetical protein
VPEAQALTKLARVQNHSVEPGGMLTIVKVDG